MAFDLCIATYEATYPKAAECLAQDREVLFAFRDFLAEHWGHIRTANQIESTFATVHARTDKTSGCLSRITMLAVVFKLYQNAAKRWYRLRTAHYLPEVVHGIVFKQELCWHPPQSDRLSTASLCFYAYALEWHRACTRIEHIHASQLTPARAEGRADYIESISV
jgi:hypothetical protein